MADKFFMACELLKDITVVKEEEKEGEKEKEGRVTKSFLRKVYEILGEAEGKEEYIISVGYIVARRVDEAKKERKKREIGKKEEIKVEDIEVVKFFVRLKRLLSENLQGDWSKVREELKSVLEHAIKIYYIKAAEVGEDPCMKR